MVWRNMYNVKSYEGGEIILLILFFFEILLMYM